MVHKDFPSSLKTSHTIERLTPSLNVPQPEALCDDCKRSAHLGRRPFSGRGGTPDVRDD